MSEEHLTYVRERDIDAYDHVSYGPSKLERATAATRTLVVLGYVLGLACLWGLLLVALPVQYDMVDGFSVKTLVGVGPYAIVATVLWVFATISSALVSAYLALPIFVLGKALGMDTGGCSDFYDHDDEVEIAVRWGGVVVVFLLCGMGCVEFARWSAGEAPTLFAGTLLAGSPLVDLIVCGFLATLLAATVVTGVVSQDAKARVDAVILEALRPEAVTTVPIGYFGGEASEDDAFFEKLASPDYLETYRTEVAAIEKSGSEASAAFLSSWSVEGRSCH